ncbi:hypothetical protein CORC01_13500 [Colletotrichum orchidophilum]|uniref:C2H2-type domain-containing protein n=1 Tax=Colletotrichum orchidophilum TaxID=1209926 RepID=A0A1G4APU1_9PEZI|nr:uncharacterized protein CORC01_13500 [Colletotrichum orchidophilum]OHE91189.1 hypothetical protein CORC01_13500 [Colletotrichum orchidophilum]
MDPTKQSQMASVHGSETRASVGKSTSQGFAPQKTPVPWALMNFYGNDTSSPWVPQGIFVESQQGQQVNVPGDSRRRNQAVLNGPWRSPLPSDCGTIPQGYLPSDSGYESRTKHSVENASVFNDVDRSQDTHSISGQLMDIQFSGTPTESQWNLATPSMSVTHHGAVDNKLVCQNCGASCKTKSELNKHHQRHRKAFKCEVEGCSRTEGFGTTNDLERHKGSVHPEIFNPSLRYRCHIGSCQTKDKKWPRADNFRQHLKRVHHQNVNSEDDLSDFVFQPPAQRSSGPTYTQDAQNVLEGVGVGSEFYQANSMTWDGPSPIFEDVQLSPQESVGGMEIVLVDPSLARMNGAVSGACLESPIADKVISNAQLHDNDCHPVCDSSQPRQQYVQPGEISKAPSPRAMTGTRRGQKSSVIREAQSASAPAAVSLNIDPNANKLNSTRNDTFEASPTDVMDCEVTSTTPIPRASDDTSTGSQPANEDPAQGEKIFHHPILLSPSKGPSEKTMLECLSKMPRSIIERFMKTQKESNLEGSTPTANSSADSQHQCSSCAKVFNRKCELNCKKKFGSKNDWKRHENSQHFQLEVWKCHEKRSEDDSENCGKVCHRRETFRSHLKNEHKMDNMSNIEQTLEKCRVGRNGEPKFWCGFCGEIVEITRKGANAWAERFDHIDNHYAGRGGLTKKDHSEWAAVDPDTADVDPTGSQDDLSDAESADDVIVSGSRKSTNNGKLVNGQSRKRSLDDGAEPDHKRMKTYMWSCCSCECFADYTVHSTCVGCYHRRCPQCSGEWVQIQEDRDAKSTGGNLNHV